MTLDEKPLYSKGKHKQNEKTIFRMKVNICKLCDQQGLNIQNIQPAYTDQSQTHYQKYVEYLSRLFFKKDLQVTIRQMRRYSTSLIVRAMQVKSTMRYHLALVRMAMI